MLLSKNKCFVKTGVRFLQICSLLIMYELYPPLWSDLLSISSKSSSSSCTSSESTFLVVVVWVELDSVKSVSEDHKYWAPLSLSSSPYGIPSLWILLRPKKSFQNYTESLAPTNFSGAVFTCAHFQKLAQISSICDFHHISTFLVTND